MDIGACTFEPGPDALSGDIYLALSGEATEVLLFDILGLGPVFEDFPGLDDPVIALLADFGGEFTLTTVPEPGALALFGIGLVGLGFARRRKAAA